MTSLPEISIHFAGTGGLV